MTNTTSNDEQTAAATDAPAAHPAATTGITGVQFLLVATAIGAAVSISLGVYGNTHAPTGDRIVSFGFPAVLPMKAWLTTGAMALVVAQVASAMWMWGRLPGVSRPAPAWAVHGHRWFGTAAFLLTLPVAYHCLWSLGFQDRTTRVLLHSLLGCAFYGAFTTKMLLLRSDRVPARSLPLAGGLLATVLVAIWWTSSFWFFTTIGFPGI
ncbi:DUF6529 family protein [Ilumatobacter coccineus]|uniref:Cytochrome b561 domain-containing protein n=1 Tax=Ilumatobacter coccineus (strain NBRC 103263 / KCTC 29153 / YM16-304) TaxID=1313172 RepID=A0A6C7EFU8_ILUCY|nr:DUF6529 family protein [Ilumatobacter coccineus]BAN04039.1 hypothetical protein YM304_37250 [Ilumatobacter coccineus YM16-304]